MQENADEEEDIHLGMVKSGKTAELEILFIQLRPLCFRQLVMWISAIKAVLFLMATMIRHLRPYLAWLEMVSYISVIVTSTLTYVNVRVKNAFGYGIDLTPEMEKAVQKKLAELKQLTIPWGAKCR